MLKWINTTKGKLKLQVDQNADRIRQCMFAACQCGHMEEWMLLWCCWAVTAFCPALSYVELHLHPCLCQALLSVLTRGPVPLILFAVFSYN